MRYTNYQNNYLLTVCVKVQIAFFLENWGEIRTSDAMKTIWQQIRVGRHPGFEEGLSSC